ncbi:hypothetical protein [Methylobacterium radiotolerans]|uniref:Flagellar protein FlgN n=1 Tax=Methylobacterium radiotolerans (strain ATCC 27329 / DSM 1819 / JCM 2831 / NBRC 15690 / NCIMB 10815 / 0-1) TaxID=426355 RepID=B1M0H1_METRJ|nr:MULTISPECIES: hypothetical protein [Methylobacterium]ACB27493.1 conserved hypothetical protein [Methylobacterium radiotolerans JCM 2831]KTS09937.1 hypothetical protein SB3_09935 [Methylobacterium radiotolerans]KTS46604.1 hypothetical protein SB2_17295 [Methylobacterium radiotolerans]MDE3747775.1 hypothetical protein [Methylobacterium radiotolerans]PVY96797.1 hypothetical protein C7388_11755 [Methylobacterium organophilum]
MQRAEPLRVGDRVTAEALVAGVLGNMAALEAVLAEEAAYVREGRLQEGVAAAEPKAALAAAYMQGLEVAKANAVALKRFHPEGVEALRMAHRRFTAAVEANQTVLASARTVSEGLIKTLAEEIGKAQLPSGYGRQAPAPSPYGRGVRSGPLVLSRNL